MSYLRAIRKGSVAILVGLFLYGCGNIGSTPATETPEATSTPEPTIVPPRTGDIAPDFSLPDSNGNIVSLSDKLQDNRLVILVFYQAFD